eukprot:4580547-Prorocentrum_lima.AAC.1
MLQSPPKPYIWKSWEQQTQLQASKQLQEQRFWVPQGASSAMPGPRRTCALQHRSQLPQQRSKTT